MNSMKTIGIVVDSDINLAEILKENLLEVFKDFVEINIYRLKHIKSDEKIVEDALLVMSREKAIETFKHVENRENVITIQRTITIDAFVKLLTIPQAANVLVVNDNDSTTIEFAAYLNAILKNIKLEPYIKGMDTSKYKIVITPSELSHIPKNIDVVFDTGHRVIDSTTFIQIMSILKIENPQINNRLLEYFNTIISINNGINEKFIDLVDKEQILKALLSNTSDGILILDSDKKVKLYNEKLALFLNIKENIIGKKINYVLEKHIQDADLIDKLSTENKLESEIWIKDNRYFNFSKKTIIEMGKINGYLINIIEITYIKKIEQNLAGKLMGKGQVARYSFEDIYTRSEKLEHIIELSKNVAKSDYSVMIQGESGTGKELFAQAIHNHSNRKNQPFLAINCAALPEQLLESELFGYVGGSFTGALKDGKKGLFESANHGTIFLDEIGDMPLNLQSKLLRVLQENQISRLGAHEIINVDVRIIAATHKNLTNQIEMGVFRSDLYYRLNVIPIQIPSLRERKEDILDLLKLFLDEDIEVSDEAAKMLHNYPWPGNIRELQNASKYILMMNSENRTLKEKHLPDYIQNYFLENQHKQIEVEVDKKILVLKAVYKLNQIEKTAGRGNISKHLSQKISEAEIRGILEKLKTEELIEISNKRLGACITEKGIRLINL